MLFVHSFVRSFVRSCIDENDIDVNDGHAEAFAKLDYRADLDDSQQTKHIQDNDDASRATWLRAWGDCMPSYTCDLVRTECLQDAICVVRARGL